MKHKKAKNINKDAKEYYLKSKLCFATFNSKHSFYGMP